MITTKHIILSLIPRLTDILPLASSFGLLAAFFYLTQIFGNYDYGHAFVKLLVLSSLLALIIFISKDKQSPPLHYRIYWLEFIFLFIAILAVLDYNHQQYNRYLAKPPFIDIGYTTQNASRLLFKHHLNPYQESISKISPNQRFHGYKKGPVMFLTYAASAYFPHQGYKITTLILFIITALLLGLLSLRSNSPPFKNPASFLCTILIFILPAVIWSQLMVAGTNDLIPILFILFAIYCLSKKLWLIVGICTGLAFSAKFALAALLIILLLRITTPYRFFIGLIIGLLPLFIFLAWDFSATINNTILFHTIKPADSTSLYQLTPPALHYLFPTIQILLALYFLITLFKKTANYQTITLYFTILLLVFEITYREIHLNHLVTIAPFLALLISWHRHSLYNFLLRKTSSTKLAWLTKKPTNL